LTLKGDLAYSKFQLWVREMMSITNGHNSYIAVLKVQ
jgi:hypothetical protein